MPSLRKASQASAGVRVQGVSTVQTVKTVPGILQRIIVANADAAVQTLTVADNITTLIVLRIPAGDTRQFDIGVPFGTSLKVTPSSANLDALVISD
jgi:hypothetical protein